MANLQNERFERHGGMGGCRFNELIWTVHTLAPGESQGKASNVNYGVRQGMHYFAKIGKYLVTFMC